MHRSRALRKALGRAAASTAAPLPVPLPAGAAFTAAVSGARPAVRVAADGRVHGGARRGLATLAASPSSLASSPSSSPPPLDPAAFWAGLSEAQRQLLATFPQVQAEVIDACPRDFVTLKVVPVPEFQVVLAHLQHVPSGAEYLHCYSRDTNNVFAVGFCTPVADDTGVPHILEHTVLCGSRQFPVRDPFFLMLQRSVSTYMNACTGDDATWYPFSSENAQDFENLRAIYLDAVFSPLLRQNDFRQEGWRLERDDAAPSSDPAASAAASPSPAPSSSPTKGFKFGGVVYNEMKGALSEWSALYRIALQKHLLKGTNYANESGGNPRAITDLTYEQLKAFWARHYHPSNARFWSYGDLPLARHIDGIRGRLDGVDRRPAIVSKVAQPTVAPADHDVTITAPFDPNAPADQQGKIGLTWLTHSVEDSETTFELSLIGSLLMDGPTSPLYQALLESKLGSGYLTGSGLDTSIRWNLFTLGVQGCKPEHFARIQQTILDTLAQVCRDGGFPAQKVDVTLRQYEMSLKHKVSNFGIQLVNTLYPFWVQGGDVSKCLSVTDNIQRFRAKMQADPGYLAQRMRQLLLDNPNHIALKMVPDAEFEQQLAAEELTRLVRHVQQADLAQVEKDNAALKQSQETKQDIGCLPKLSLADLQQAPARRYPMALSYPQGVAFHTRQTTTNGLNYFNIAKSLDGLPSPLHPHLPLYTSLFAMQPTRSKTLSELEMAIRSVSGRLGIDFWHATDIGDLQRFHTHLGIALHTLDAPDAEQAFQLASEIFQETVWDEDRVLTALYNAADAAGSDLASAGHRLAIQAASGALTSARRFAEQTGGLAYVQHISDLAKQGPDALAQAMPALRAINDFVVNAAPAAHTPNALKSVVIHQSDVPPAAYERFLESMPCSGWMVDPSSSSSSSSAAAAAAAAEDTAMKPSFTKRFYELPFAVNYTASAFVGAPYAHRDSPLLQLLAKVLSDQYLHTEVREKGGAYGGFASYAPTDGIFSMASYRDPPRTSRTMAIYERAAHWAAGLSEHVTESSLECAKLTLVGAMSAPVDAAAEGMEFYTHGITAEHRQARREAILGATRADLERVAQTYLAHQPHSDVILGNAEEGKHLADFGFTAQTTFSDA
ncbi:hypothetical protein CXG81DRAFT_8975 [Caulochytrium protostelioides]|uniref:Presequence protease, mitochondrial n=1 Tax=Caulochytrium protostelioides TaxID=1555241 RepID=A0A4P9X0D6_9FUNG|nr:hypothetical protein CAUPRSCDRAFT_7029 [Caulochytrium protostelioides]RKP03808.1 hypothetical protein CXG81DRAFT_8975 [Caulochytrium protostelioides]|eukprot:RKP03808.1 hypothetical protein CXG81DRAFT_8975 [Caulochytrium protostelioides]